MMNHPCSIYQFIELVNVLNVIKHDHKFFYNHKTIKDSTLIIIICCFNITFKAVNFYSYILLKTQYVQELYYTNVIFGVITLISDHLQALK